MNEKVWHFGTNKSLVGVVADPPADKVDPNKPAIILLNSGLLHRVGPSRLYVQLARKMAADGFITFRFDFSGIGDSPRRRDELSFDESSILEARVAMDFISSKRDVKKFVLSGICSGADAAFFTACEDSRIVGIVPIELFTQFSKGYMIASYKKRLFSTRGWSNILAGKSDIFKMLKQVPANLKAVKTTPATADEPGDTSQPLSAERWVEGFHILNKNGVKLCLIYSAGSPAFYNYRQHFEKPLQSLNPENQTRVHHMDSADHGFTLLFHQAQLITLIAEWMRFYFS